MTDDLDNGRTTRDGLVEVSVITNGHVFAVDVKSVLPTRGYTAYCRRADVGLIKPFLVCPKHQVAFGRQRQCPAKHQCTDIHLVDGAVKMKCPKRLRTPCCWQHGDSMCPRPSGNISVRGPGKVWRFRSGNLALTSHPCTNDPNAIETNNVRLSLDELCVHHLNCKCKFGRECEKVHVCRIWAKKVGLTAALMPKEGEVKVEKGAGTVGSDDEWSERVLSLLSQDNASSRSTASAGDIIDDMPELLPGLDDEEEAGPMSPQLSIAMNVVSTMLHLDDAPQPQPMPVASANLADTYWLALLNP